MPEPPKGTVTFLFTDIQGSTRRWEEHPEAMRKAIGIHDNILRKAIEDHGGYPFTTIGDAFCAAFSTAPQALAAAVDAHRDLFEQDWGSLDPIRARIALHTGAAEQRDSSYFGPTVDRVMRLLGVGHGGQTLLSMPAEQLLHDQLPAGVTLVDMGERRLRDLTHKEHIFQALIEGLPADYPPLKTLDERPNNLPVRTTPLIGRARELDECLSLIRDGGVRLLTLTGPGGIGKTRLGLQLGALLLDDFEDGVYVASLAAIADAELVTSSIAQVLGLAESGGQPLISRLKEYLRTKKLLLILDNFEGLLGAAPGVWELLASAPGLKMIVTSRSVLNLSVEQEYKVGPLSVPEPGQAADPDALARYESVALFVSRAQAVKNDFRLTKENAAAVAEICELLEGIPLAIELAAARTRILPPPALLSRLSGAHSAARLQLLTGGDRDLPARQRTMQATIEWSYDLLDDQEKTLFRRLSIFVRGCTLEAAEEVLAGADGDASIPPLDLDILEGLSSLLDKSFLRHDRVEGGDVRFRMLEIIREYGLKKLVESGEYDALGRRRTLYLLQMAEQAETRLVGTQQKAMLDRLEADHDNMRAALNWANEHHEAEIGLRLAGALWRFWYMRGYLTEGLNWVLAMLSVPGAAEKTQARAKALNAGGNLLYNLGDYDTADSVHTESLSISRRLGDKRGISASLNNLGLIARNHGDFARAIKLYEEALALNRELNNRSWQAINLNNLSTVYQQAGDREKARILQEESLAIFTALGDRWGMAMSLADLGKIMSDLANYTEALQLYERAIVLERELGDKRNVADILISTGQINWKQGNYEKAASAFQQGLKEFREMGDRKGVASATNYLGNVALYRGDVAEARSLYTQSLALRTELRDKRDLAASNNNLGLVSLEEGKAREAGEFLKKAVMLWTEVGDKERIATSLTNSALASIADGDTTAARDLLAEALEQARDAGDKWSIGHAVDGQAQLALRLGNTADAERSLRDSLAMRDAVRDPRGVAFALSGLATTALRQGQMRRAAVLAGACDGLLKSTSAVLDAIHRSGFEQTVAAVRETLTAADFNQAWDEGSHMTFDQAVAYAAGEGALAPG